MPYSRSDILNQNTQDFPNNNAGQITPAILRDFNANYVNSVVFIGDPTVSASYAATASIATSASYAVNTSNANTATSASYSNTSTSASYAVNSTSASYANTATLADTASYFNGNAVSASYAATASIATSASYSNNSTSASYALTASFALNAPTINTGSFVTTSSFNAYTASTNTFTGSIQTQVNSLQAATGGYATLTGSNVFSGPLNTFQNAVTMSNVQVTGTASVKFLYVEYQSSSIIFSSGSNTLGDAANDTQTLWGTVVLPTGPLVVTGSATATLGFTGSLQGTASFANNSTSASYSNTATSASYSNNSTTASYALTSTSASYSNNSTSASYALTASFAANSTPAFPFTGSAQITGSLGVTGSITVANNLTISGSVTSPSRFDIVSNNTGGTIRQITPYIIDAGLAGIAYGANIIIGTTAQTSTGSLIISGSQNYITLNTLMSNANANAGRKSGFVGRNNFILTVPQTVSSSGMELVALNTSWVAAAITVTNAFSGSSYVVPTITNSFINSTVTYTGTSGSFGITNANINAPITATNTWASSSLVFNNSLILGSAYTVTTYTTASDSTAKTLSAANNSIIAGTAQTFIKDGSVSNSGIQNSIIVSNNALVTGSASTTGSGALFGTWPLSDGRLNDFDHIRLAIGTGTGTSARRTSLYVSSSGDTVIQNNLLVTGSSLFSGSLTLTGSLNATSVTSSLLGTASYADNTTSASYANNATSASYSSTSTSASYSNNSTSASYALNATSASYAPDTTFPYTGSAQITGSLGVTGSITAIGVTSGMTGSLVLNQQSGLNLFTSIQNIATQRNMQQYVTESLQTNQLGGANIYIGYTAQTSTGSLIVSGSANYINTTGLITNASAIAGTKSGFAGSRNFIFAVPTLPTASFNDPQWVLINNSWIGTAPTITNNYLAVQATTSITNAFVNSAITANLKSGSLTISNTNVNWTTTINANLSQSINTISNAYLAGSNVLTINQFDLAGTGSGPNGTVHIASTGFYGGNSHTYYIASGSQFNSGIRHSVIVGETLIVTGSITTSGMGAGIFGTYNTSDGRINHLDHIRFAVGTGTAPGVRRTSLYVSSSGDTVIQNNLLVTGSSTFSGSLTLTGSLNATSVTSSLFGTASFANNATSASYSLVATSASYATNSTSASYANTSTSASYSNNATSASYSITATTAATASYYNGSVVSASYANNSTSASYALTASYAMNGGGGGAAFPYTGSALITGSLGVTGSLSTTAGIEVKAGDLDFVGGNINIYNGNINQFAGASSLKTTVISGSLGVTGSVRGNIVTVTAVAQTASIDLSLGNAFVFNANATAASASLLTLTNIPTGSNQKFSLLISQSVAGGANVYFDNTFQFPSASQYTVSTTTGSVDLLTFETYTY